MDLTQINTLTDQQLAALITGKSTDEAAQPTESMTDAALFSAADSAQCHCCLQNRVESAGYTIVTDRGDVKRPGRA